MNAEEQENTEQNKEDQECKGEFALALSKYEIKIANMFFYF